MREIARGARAAAASAMLPLGALALAATMMVAVVVAPAGTASETLAVPPLTAGSGWADVLETARVVEVGAGVWVETGTGDGVAVGSGGAFVDEPLQPTMPSITRHAAIERGVIVLGNSLRADDAKQTRPAHYPRKSQITLKIRPSAAYRDFEPTPPALSNSRA